VTGFFAGYASIFHTVDYHNDCIIQGAFKKHLNAMERANKMPKLLWQHQRDQPIGIWHFIEEDKKGLYVEGQFLLDIQKGQEAYCLMKAGAIDGLSIGYFVKESQINPQHKYREITEIELLEISIVTFPANAR